MTHTNANSYPSLTAWIEARQAELHMTDEQLAVELGFKNGNVIAMIKRGTLSMPRSKVKALAAAISVDVADVLRLTLSERVPELLAVIDEVFNPLRLSRTEIRLIEHCRKVSNGRESTPIVFDGEAVIALVSA